ncbi:tigger transposable element-derived protein 4-like [Myzus persicae]|uniref:tigger transposable element-derived protein 4-like n=1 Tax=Myzus persicae TaxID=13164 RepID=UPI000B9340C2|nr:tigger transposable element-derived protein 4-like [Myzus persicae]
MLRRQITLDEKIGIIRRLENGEGTDAIAKEFSASSSTISTIWSRRDSLKTMFENTSLRTKQLRTAQHIDLEEAVLAWFKKQRLANVPVSGPMLKVKTEQLAEGLKMEDFKCSASWILSFRQRHNIGFGKMAGESTAVCSKCHDDVWPGYEDDEFCCEILESDLDGFDIVLTPDNSKRISGSG